MGEVAGQARRGEGGSPPPDPNSSTQERVLLLECRLEQLGSALAQARANADRVRGSLAEASAREADQARRHSLVQQELAEARAEIASLHERLGRSEALRAELEGHLFEAGAASDSAELIRLRREVMSQRERSLNSERALARTRARMEELLLSREALLARVAEWQQLVRHEDPDAVDLAEFIAELRRDILHLERRTADGEREKAALRQRLVRAGLDPDGPPEEDTELADGADESEPDPDTRRRAAYVGALVPEEREDPGGAQPPGRVAWQSDDPPGGGRDRSTTPVGRDDGTRGEAHDPAPAAASAAGDAAPGPGSRAREPEPAAKGRSGAREPEPAAKGRSGDQDDDSPAEAARPGATRGSPPEEGEAASTVSGLDAPDPVVRASAYERLTRVLQGEPSRLAEELRPGLGDPDPRVRRRAVVAAAMARGLALPRLLGGMKEDPDPRVRRVVHQVLRHASPVDEAAGDEGAPGGSSERGTPEAVS